MRLITYTLLLLFFVLSACAESLDDQFIANIEENRIFEIDLEERRYDFGYMKSTEDDPNRPNQNRYREFIALATDDVALGGATLRGVSQLIGIELEFSRPLGPQEISIDLRLLSQSGTITFAKVFLAEDFNFNTRESRRRINLSNGQLIIKEFSNGARTITLNANAGGLSVAGAWAGKLEGAEFFF